MKKENNYYLVMVSHLGKTAVLITIDYDKFTYMIHCVLKDDIKTLTIFRGHVLHKAQFHATLIYESDDYKKIIERGMLEIL